MRKKLLISCLFYLSLWANTAITENEPNSLVEGIISAITGDLYIQEDDIVIQGAEPLALSRSYLSAKGQGNWTNIGFYIHQDNPKKDVHLSSHLEAVRHVQSNTLEIPEPNGSILMYRFDHSVPQKHHRTEHYYVLDQREVENGLTNTARGALTAQTNLKNQYVVRSDQGHILTVYYPDGRLRRYRNVHHQKKIELPIEDLDDCEDDHSKKVYKDYRYILMFERLSNGNSICYSWDHDNRLDTIRTSDAEGNKTFAWAKFHYFGKIKKTDKGRTYSENPDFDIETSDGKKLHYRHLRVGKHKDSSTWYLNHINISDSPPENISYYEKTKDREQVISSIALPNQRTINLGYYEKGNNSTWDVQRKIKKEYDPVYCRIKCINAPVGHDAHLHLTHAFAYHDDHTTVIDIDRNYTNYYWTPQRQLRLINHFIGREEFYNQHQFVWGAGNLLCKSFISKSGALFSTRYDYDGSGNVLQKRFYGNLSGQGKAVSLDSAGFPIDHRSECLITKFAYSQDGRNLQTRQEEANGHITTYEYHPGTNLLYKEFTYDKDQLKIRKFYLYDENHFLIREITDDGSTQDPNNLSNVQTRLIKNYTRRTSQPYLGMPEIIEEKYWDGSLECLLKKTVLHYITGAKISQKDVYDTNGIFQYSLFYRFNEKNQLQEESNALGQIARYGYDELGNKIFHQDFGSRLVQRMEYDYSNRLVHLEEAGDGVVHHTRHTYNAKHKCNSTTDLFGSTTHYQWDGFGHLIATSLPRAPEAGVIHCTYDPAGNKTSQTDARGLTTTYTYNSTGKPTHIQYADGSEERFSYNLDGTLQAHIDQIGCKTTYAYDFLKRCTSQITPVATKTFTYDAFNLIEKTDGEGHVTSYTYDGAGRRISKERGDKKIFYSYDNLGRLACKQEGDLLHYTDYDLLDRVIEERDEDIQGHLLSKIQYSYDEAGNRSEIKRFIHNEESLEQIEYDAFNRPIKQIDPLGYITTIEYDESHNNSIGQRVLRKIITDPLELKTIEIHDALGRVVVLEKWNSKLLHREVKTYDLNGNLTHIDTTVFHPDQTSHQTTTDWEYDVMNRIKTLIESGQRTTTYTYNPKGLLEEIRKPDGVALKNTYDKIGRLQIQTSSDQSIHYVYKYNRVDQLIKVEDLITKTKTIRKYDPLGNLLYEQLGNQLTLTNTYDERSRRQTLALPDERTVSFSYDALHLRSVSYEDYTHQFNTYDLAGHLIQETPIGSLGISFDYTYDIAAKPLSFSSPYFHHHILSYDPVGNIRSARFPSENITYDYDALYHLTLEKGQTTHNYAYDSLHNRLQKDQETYQVDRLNQITSVFTYDKNGNPISKNNAIYSYDAFDRLISIELPSTLLQFTYDFDHRRLTKMVYHKSANDWNLAQTLYFLYDGHREIGAFDAQGTPLELRILGRSEESERGSSVMFKLEGETFIPIHDLSGNIRAIISPQARTIETLSYTTFGEEVTPSPIPWKFSSKRYDPESGLYYYGRRYYDPALGRWLTPDPQGYNDGLNLYAFVQNNPLTHFDSYGLWARPIFSAPTFSPPRFDPPKIESTWQATTGFITATTDCALNTGAFASDVGFAVTIPARFIYNHTLGNSTLSKDWQQHQYNQRYLIQQSQRWLQAQLHADPQNSYYRYSRQIASPAVEVTSLYYLGGPKLVKYGITVCQEGILLARRYLSSLKNSNVTTSARLAALESRTASLSIHRQAGKLSIENPKPIWSATKDQTSVRNAYRHWKDHGSEFPELLNAKQYVEQAHKLFKSKKDYILTKTRPNGEHLIYDVQTNTFGAFVEDGTPKTMFKPIKGITYWETRN